MTVACVGVLNVTVTGATSWGALRNATETLAVVPPAAFALRTISSIHNTLGLRYGIVPRGAARFSVTAAPLRVVSSVMVSDRNRNTAVCAAFAVSSGA